MKHVHTILEEALDRMDEKEAKAKRMEAHKQGIAETRRILGMEPSPEDSERFHNV